MARAPATAGRRQSALPAGGIDAATRKALIIGGIACLVVVVLAVAIAVPLSRSFSSKSSPQPGDAPLVPGAAVSPAAAAKNKRSSAPLSLVPCTYEPTGSVLVMDSRAPPWPFADNLTWVDSAAGITYRPDEADPFWVSPPGASKARVYPFKVKDSGKYIFQMLSTAVGKSEFNDVWVRFPFGRGLEFWSKKTGLNTMRGVQGGGTKWTKWYQNRLANNLGGFAVDNNKHSIATVDVLQAGRTYSLEIAGRSSRFLIHRLYAARCKGQTCANAGFTFALLSGADEVTTCVA